MQDWFLFNLWVRGLTQREKEQNRTKERYLKIEVNEARRNGMFVLVNRHCLSDAVGEIYRWEFHFFSSPVKMGQFRVKKGPVYPWAFPPKGNFLKRVQLLLTWLGELIDAMGGESIHPSRISKRKRKEKR